MFIGFYEYRVQNWKDILHCGGVKHDEFWNSEKTDSRSM